MKWIAKASPPSPSSRSNGLWPSGQGTFLRYSASGLRKISFGPMKPASERLAADTATSAASAAEAPLLSESWWPARIAR